MSVKVDSISANLERVREQVARAATRAGRRPEEITLVAVSKTFPAEAIRAAYGAGLRHFGENRVQEWESKRPHLADLDATWHLVGHLQSNKARRAAQAFHLIDSVDSFALAEKLDRAVGESSAVKSPSSPRAGEGGARRLPVLLEVRLSEEGTKTGASEGELPRLAEGVIRLQNIELRGLMTIPPYLDDPDRVRPYFRRLRELRDSLRAQFLTVSHAEESLLPELSMGMSHDFEVAIEEGATQIRLGTALFGPRPAQ